MTKTFCKSTSEKYFKRNEFTASVIEYKTTKSNLLFNEKIWPVLQRIMGMVFARLTPIKSLDKYFSDPVNNNPQAIYTNFNDVIGSMHSSTITALEQFDGKRDAFSYFYRIFQNSILAERKIITSPKFKTLRLMKIEEFHSDDSNMSSEEKMDDLMYKTNSYVKPDLETYKIVDNNFFIELANYWKTVEEKEEKKKTKKYIIREYIRLLNNTEIIDSFKNKKEFYKYIREQINSKNIRVSTSSNCTLNVIACHIRRINLKNKEAFEYYNKYFTLKGF